MIMKAIILAAGKGTRLGALTSYKPKCMVEYRGKPIIDHIFGTLKTCGIEDINVVDGYRNDVLRGHLKSENVSFYKNKNFENTNMVYSFFCAEDAFDDDMIITYSDIIYTPNVLKKLMRNDDDIAVVVDKDWEKLWRLRMDDPLLDAETMKIDDKGRVVELGKKAKKLSEIEAQYIGLIKISRDMIPRICKYYKALDKEETYDGQSFNNMYMTSLIQKFIDYLAPVYAVEIHGGWLEVDSISDLKKYSAANISSNLILDPACFSE